MQCLMPRTQSIPPRNMSSRALQVKRLDADLLLCQNAVPGYRVNLQCVVACLTSTMEAAENHTPCSQALITATACRLYDLQGEWCAIDPFTCSVSHEDYLSRVTNDTVSYVYCSSGTVSPAPSPEPLGSGPSDNPYYVPGAVTGRGGVAETPSSGNSSSSSGGSNGGSAGIGGAVIGSGGAAATPASPPTAPAEAPAAPGEAPATPGEAPATPGVAPATPGEAPATPGEAPATPGEAPVAPATPAEPAELPAAPATAGGEPAAPAAVIPAAPVQEPTSTPAAAAAVPGAATAALGAAPAPAAGSVTPSAAAPAATSPLAPPASGAVPAAAPTPSPAPVLSPSPNATTVQQQQPQQDPNLAADSTASTSSSDHNSSQIHQKYSIAIGAAISGFLVALIALAALCFMFSKRARRKVAFFYHRHVKKPPRCNPDIEDCAVADIHDGAARAGTGGGSGFDKCPLNAGGRGWGQGVADTETGGEVWETARSVKGSTHGSAYTSYAAAAPTAGPAAPAAAVTKQARTVDVHEGHPVNFYAIDYSRPHAGPFHTGMYKRYGSPVASGGACCAKPLPCGTPCGVCTACCSSRRTSGGRGNSPTEADLLSEWQQVVQQQVIGSPRRAVGAAAAGSGGSSAAAAGVNAGGASGTGFRHSNETARSSRDSSRQKSKHSSVGASSIDEERSVDVASSGWRRSRDGGMTGRGSRDQYDASAAAAEIEMPAIEDMYRSEDEVEGYRHPADAAAKPYSALVMSEGMGGVGHSGPSSLSSPPNTISSYGAGGGGGGSSSGRHTGVSILTGTSSSTQSDAMVIASPPSFRSANANRNNDDAIGSPGKGIGGSVTPVLGKVTSSEWVTDISFGSSAGSSLYDTGKARQGMYLKRIDSNMNPAGRIDSLTSRIGSIDSTGKPNFGRRKLLHMFIQIVKIDRQGRELVRLWLVPNDRPEGEEDEIDRRRMAMGRVGSNSLVLPGDPPRPDVDLQMNLEKELVFPMYSFIGAGAFGQVGMFGGEGGLVGWVQGGTGSWGLPGWGRGGFWTGG